MCLISAISASSVTALDYWHVFFARLNPVEKGRKKPGANRGVGTKANCTH